MLKALVNRRHPDYNKMLEHWDFLIETYEGGRQWFGTNIFRYIKEGDAEYVQRIKRAYRFNHSREIVDLVNKYVFKGEIRRNTEEALPSVTKFWKAATRSGVDIDSYMRHLSKLSSTYGRIWVVVDSINKGTGNSVREADVQVYSYEVAPQDMLDMSFDDEGNLLWVLIRESVRDDKDPLSSTGDVSYRYRLWTQTEWVLIEDKDGGKSEEPTYEMVNSGIHALGVVPVFSVDHMMNESPYTSPSLIGDIAYLDRACANYLSNLDAIIQDQTFSQLAMPAQGLLPGQDGHAAMIEAGTKRIFTYDGEAGQQPFYLSPDPKQAELIITSIKQIINEIYHSVGVAGERTKSDNSMGIDNSSGVAKAFDFERVNSLLVSKAAALQRAENKMLELVLRWHGVETFDAEDDTPLVAYPTNFDTRSLYDELDISTMIEQITAPIELKRYQLKQVVAKMYPFMAVKDKTELLSAIDDMTDQLTAFAHSSLGNEVPTDPATPDGSLPAPSDATAKKTDTAKPAKP